jgi:molybdopterin molybdotransferase
VEETERVPLHGARGHVTVADVKAPVDLPPFDNSAVDSYAVRYADLEPDGDTPLVIAGLLTARRQPDVTFRPGQAIRVFTGAPMPAGTMLEAQHIALAAALGLTEIAVPRRLTVAIFSTGDEVVEPGSARGGAAIYDANRHLLSALLKRLGAVVTDLGILSDNPDELARALATAAAWHDLVISSGDVSTGEAAHVRSAVERIGSLVIWRVAIKPGRPVAMGVVRDIASKAGAPHSGAAFVGSPARGRKSCYRCRCAPPLPTGKRKTAANMCGWRCGAATTARSRRSSTRGMTPAFSRR